MLPILKENNIKIDKEFFVNPFFSTIVRKIEDQDIKLLILTQSVHDRLIKSINEFCEENKIEIKPNRFGCSLTISKDNFDKINLFFQGLIEQYISNYGFYI